MTRENSHIDRDELFARLLEGTTRHWHWYSFHFESVARGRRIAFVDALLDALLGLDAAMAGYAARMAAAICSLGGRERHKPDYEQLLQILAEIHVAYRAVTAAWPEGTTFADEPAGPGSARNPELVISTPQFRLGVEVKAPSLLAHEERRSTRPDQAGGRIFSQDKMAGLAGSPENITMPRDNPVKDFLISADAKFSPFRQDDPDFYGVLAIVWDDFIYEPITALLHPASGLLTAESFARAEDGRPLQFAHVDGILLVSHLQYLKWALSADGHEPPYHPGDKAFQWDAHPARPVAYVDTPHGRPVPAWVRTEMQTSALADIPGAEYRVSDWVKWVDVPGPGK